MPTSRRKLQARQQFEAEIDGATVIVLEGARFPSNDPIVKGREALFEPTGRAPASKSERKQSRK
jgi:hypothetical protein